MRKRYCAMDNVEIKDKMKVEKRPEGNFVVCYKGYMLWNCLHDNLTEYDFYVYDPTKTEYPEDDPSTYYIVCVDEHGDKYTFGNFTSKELLMDWLDRPYRLW